MSRWVEIDIGYYRKDQFFIEQCLAAKTALPESTGYFVFLIRFTRNRLRERFH